MQAGCPQCMVGFHFLHFSASFWDLGSLFDWPRNTEKRPRRHLGAQVSIVKDFFWIWGSLMGSISAHFGWVVFTLGSENVNRTWGLFFKMFKISWTLQKLCFAMVKHTFSEIPVSHSGVTFRCYLDHFDVVLDVFLEHFCGLIGGSPCFIASFFKVRMVRYTRTPQAATGWC